MVDTLLPWQREFIERYSAGETVVIIHARNAELHYTCDALRRVAAGVGRVLAY